MYSLRNGLVTVGLVLASIGGLNAQDAPEDYLRAMQFEAVESKKAEWIHWGDNEAVFSNWTYHSNRLIPVYSFGLKLDSVAGANSIYRNGEKLKQIYDRIPDQSVNSKADYFDQTDIYRLQKNALAEGGTHKNLILIVFDGMDWQTTQAASIYKHKQVLYTKGRGTGLSFLDFGVKNELSDYGYMVTSPHNNGTNPDVNGQVVRDERSGKLGGYSAPLGGFHPWSKASSVTYLLGKLRSLPDVVTDSAASATSMNSGIKTYNGSINVDPDGKPVISLARQLQSRGKAVGVVSSVPFSHATPACAYANNVTRNDYQDISRDLLGLKSVAHRDNALPGMDVVIGCGWGEQKDDDRAKQGNNFVPGNKYLADEDLEKVDVKNGGKYVVAQRTVDKKGSQVLEDATQVAIEKQARLFGFFGVKGGHLPYQTADGNYDPTRGQNAMDVYEPNDIAENPTLAQMTDSALKVLSQREEGFWLLVEAGDVDWANHNNNVDDSIGSVLSGEEAFDVAVKWVEENSTWDETAIILTADHGHMMVVDDLYALTGIEKVEGSIEKDSK